MSKEAREFLEDNGYKEVHNYLLARGAGVATDITNIMEEYFAFRLGKLLTDGDARMCNDKQVWVKPTRKENLERDTANIPLVYEEDDYKVCKTCGEDV